MRVLLINDSARPHTGGGNRVVVETCRWLEKAGHQAALAYHDGVASDVGCPSFHLPDQSKIPVPDMLARLDRIVADFQPDIVQYHTTQIMAAYPHLAARKTFV